MNVVISLALDLEWRIEGDVLFGAGLDVYLLHSNKNIRLQESGSDQTSTGTGNGNTYK